MIESAHSLSALRARIASLDRGRDSAALCGGLFATGHEGLDRALSGGLARGRLHELFAGDGGAEPAADDGWEDVAALSAMGLLLGALAAEGGAGQAGGARRSGALLWLRTAAVQRRGGIPYGPGIADLGIDPARLTIGVMADEAMLLQAAVDALRCAALGAVLVECHGRARLLDLTASRRLALAAADTGVTALLLRADAQPSPSAAETRWRVRAAPSVPLPADAPGQPAFDLGLLRRRGGPDGIDWRLTWDREGGRFTEWTDDGTRTQADGRQAGSGSGHGSGQRDGAALSGDRLSLPADRPAAHRAA